MSAPPDIIRTITRVSPELAREAAQLPAAMLADVYGRRGTQHGRIAPLSPGIKICGPALTVEVRPGDNLISV